MSSNPVLPSSCKCLSWRRFRQIFCVFSLLLLSSQLSTLLNFTSARVPVAVSADSLRQAKVSFYSSLASDLNDFFASLNYTVFEYYARYLGSGRSLPSDFYELPFSSFPFSRFFYGPDPCLSLYEDYIIIGRLVSTNGRLEFREGSLAFDGRSLRSIIIHTRGSFLGRKTVDFERVIPFDSFVQHLLRSAHPRYLSYDKQLALGGRNLERYANKFAAAFRRALRSGTEADCLAAAEIFNRFSKYYVLGSFFTARAVLVDDHRFTVQIGRLLPRRSPVLTGMNQTFAFKEAFLETITYDPLLQSFSVLDDDLPSKRLSKAGNPSRDFLWLFEYLRDVSFQKWHSPSEDGVFASRRKRSGDSPPGSFFQPKDWFDPGDSGNGDAPPDPPPEGGSDPPETNATQNADYWGPSMGMVNQKNYLYWTDELLSVAIIYNDKRACSLDNLLGEAFDLSAYAFVDRFTFDYWDDLLLQPNGPYGDMDIRYYDVLFIDDVTVDEGTYDWEEDWELSALEKQVLAEWLYSGGSIYFSSALSGRSSLVKDRFFPGDYLQLRTSNKIASAQFNVGAPSHEKDSYQIETGCYSNGDWFTGISEDNETFDWSFNQDAGYVTGTRKHGYLSFGAVTTQVTGYMNYLISPTDILDVKELDSFYLEARLAPGVIDPSPNDYWFFAVKIASNKWARIEYRNAEHRFCLGVANSLFPGWDMTKYYETPSAPIKCNGWHTLRMNFIHRENDLSTIEFVINGNIEFKLAIKPDDFETQPDLVKVATGIYAKEQQKSNVNGQWYCKHTWLQVDYIQSGVYNVDIDYSWASDSDTPVSALTGYGEFAIIDRAEGLISNSLLLGIQTRKINNDWFLDSHQTDYSLKISQKLQVPSSFARCFLSADYKKLTNLESDRLEFVIEDEDGNLLYRTLLNKEQELTANWVKTGKIDITAALRGYADRIITIALWVHGSETRIREGSDSTFVDTHALFKIDNLLLSFIGSKETIPVYLYYDESLLSQLGTKEYGSFDDSAAYNSLDSYRSFYFAEEIKATLLHEGIPNTHLVDTPALLNILEHDIPGVVVNTHPFLYTIYNGSANSPLMRWVRRSGGIFIETLAEPLSYFIDADLELVRIPQSDVALLGYDLFKSITDHNLEPSFSLFSENFDSGGSTLEDCYDLATISLQERLGGILEVQISNETNPFCVLEKTFATPIKVHQWEQYEAHYFHMDAYLENTTTIKISGTTTDGTNLSLNCVLGGKSFEPYTLNNQTYYLSIPFDSFESPSELKPYLWNSITINIDQTATMGSWKIFDYITSIQINCSANSKIDNLWLGTAGSSLQQAVRWLVSPQDYFTSDYPAALSVLEEMKSNIPGFVYAIYGKNSGVRKLLFKEEFLERIFPEQDDWTEPGATDWVISNNGALFFSNISSTGGYSLGVNLTGTETIELSKPFEQLLNAYPFSYLDVNLKANETFTANDFQEDKSLTLALIDNEGNSISFELTLEGDVWNTYQLVLADGALSGAFNRSIVKKIAFYFPINCTNTKVLYIDNLHFRTALDNRLWEWAGFLPQLENLLVLDTLLEDVYIKSKDKFGLGTVEFLAELEPISSVEFGLTSDDGSRMTFKYQSDILSWWNTNWSYRYEVIIHNTGGLLREQPVLLEIDNTTEFYQLVKTNAEDLRVVDQSQKELPFYIETWQEQGKSRIWVKIPTIKAYSKTHFYLYFGNKNCEGNKSQHFEIPFPNHRDTFDNDNWVHNAPAFISVDSTNNWLQVLTYRDRDDLWSYSPITVADHFELSFKYNTRDANSCGIIAVGLAASNSGTLYDPALTDGLFFYHYGGSSSTNWRPVFRLCRKIDGIVNLSPNDFSWQPKDHIWYTIRIIRTGDNATLEIWDESETVLYQQHTLAITGLEPLKYLYVTGRDTGHHIDQNAFVDTIVVKNDFSSEHLFVRLSALEEKTITSFNNWWNENWWNEDCPYRKEIQIAAAKDLTGYPYLYTFNDTEIYDKTLPQGEDIRFTSATGEVLSHWIKEWNRYGESSIYIRLPTIIPDTNNTIYLYYGNSDALNASNPHQTMLFYEDFSSSSLEPKKWLEDAYNDLNHTLTNKFIVTNARKNGDSYLVFNPTDIGNQYHALFPLPTDDFFIEWSQASESATSEETGQFGLGLVDEDGFVQVFLGYFDNQTSSGCKIQGFVGSSATFLTINDLSDVKDFRIEVRSTYVRLWYKNPDQSWSAAFLGNFISRTKLKRLAIIAGGFGAEGQSPFLSHAEISQIFIYQVNDGFTATYPKAEETIEKNTYYHTFELSVLVDNGVTTQEQKISFDGGFNPAKKHEYRILREDNEKKVVFYIDGLEVASFFDHLPAYSPPEHSIIVNVTRGTVVLSQIKSSEQSPTVDLIYNTISYGWGTVLEEGFAYQEPFPSNATDLGYNWQYVPGYNSERVTTKISAFQGNNWDSTLFFEYDGNTGELTSYNWKSDKLECSFEPLTDFKLSAKIDWWEEHVRTGFKVFIKLYNVNSAGDYTLVSYAAISDAWAYNNPKYYLGSTSSVSTSAPMCGPSGGVIIEMQRMGSELSLAFLSNDRSTVISSYTDSYCTILPINCIQVEFRGIWGSDMTPTYTPSHSKVWIDEITLAGLGRNLTVTKSGSFKLVGETYVDPLIISHGSGWLGFVKNSPIKPMTIDFQEEYSCAAEWIATLIEDFFVQRLVPQFDFYWQMPYEGISTENRLTYSANAELGLKSLNYIADLGSLTANINALLPDYLLPSFRPYLAFTPDHLFIDNIDDFSPIDSDSFIREWMINAAQDEGLHNFYPDFRDGVTKQSVMMFGSTLFHTTFNESFWNYNDFNFQWKDFGLPDWSKGSGLVFDDYLRRTVLKLEEQSLTKDPAFESYWSFWNETSHHYMFLDDMDQTTTNSSTLDYRCNLDGSGWPGPSVYFFNPNTTQNTFRFGSRFNFSEVEPSITTFFLEFDYWVSHANATPGFETFPVKSRIYQLKENTPWWNPLDSEDRNAKYTLMNTIQFNLTSEFFEFGHFAYDYSSVLNSLDRTKNYLLEFELVFEGNTTGYNKQNQTLYLDNFRITPKGRNGASGIGTGFGVQSELLSYQWNSNFEDIGLVVNYPYLIFSSLLSNDFVYNGGDYEIVYPVYDPTNDYTINLHFCLSNDDNLIGNHSNYDWLKVNDKIDFYIHCKELTLTPQPQELSLNILHTLNELVRVSKLPLAREKIVHKLGLGIYLDGNASNLLIGSMTIKGVAPWRKYTIPNTRNTFAVEDIFGEITGHSELAILADTYLWSDSRKLIEFRLWANSDTAVYLNDQLITTFKTGHETAYNTTKSPQGTMILNAGVNKLEVRLTNIPDGAEFSFWLLKEGFPATKANAEISSNDLGTEGLRTSTVGSNYHYYPMISAPIGLGRMTFWCYDFDSIGGTPHTPSEPLINLLANIANYEMQYRNYFLEQIKNRWLDFSEWNGLWKHYDVPYDCYNSDDRFQGTDDELEVLRRNEEIAYTVVKNFPRVLSAAKERGNLGVNYDELFSRITKFFNDLQVTGNPEGWFVDSELTLEGTITDRNATAIKFQHFDKTHTIYSLIDNRNVGPMSEHWYGFVRGYLITDENEQSCIQIKLSEAYEKCHYLGGDLNYWTGSILGIEYIQDKFGAFRIYNQTHVWVDVNITDDEGTVYLLNSFQAQKYYSLLETLNATAVCLYELTTYRTKTEEEPLLSKFQTMLGGMRSYRILGHDVTAAMYNYINDIQMNLFEQGRQECFNYLMEKELEEMIERCRDNPSELLYLLGLASDAYPDIDAMDYYMSIDISEVLNKTIEIPSSAVVPSSGILLFAAFTGSRGANGKPAGIKEVYGDIIYEDEKRFFNWLNKPTTDLSKPEIKKFFQYRDSDDKGQKLWKNIYSKASESFSSYNQLFQSLHYMDKITISAAVLINHIQSINAVGKRLENFDKTIFTDTFLTTKIKHVLIPIGYWNEDETKIITTGEKGDLIMAWKAFHSEYEGVRFAEAQSVVETGITETFQLQAIYGAPIHKLLGDSKDTSYALPTLDMDLRINRKQFNELMKKVFTINPKPKDKHYLETSLNRRQIAETTEYKYYQLISYSQGLTTYQDITFRYNKKKDVYEIVTISKGGENRFVRTGKNTYELHGMLVLYGDDPETAKGMLQDQTVTGAELWEQGYGYLEYFGTQKINGEEKKCFIFTKGEIFSLLPGKAANGVQLTRHVKLHYKEDKNYDKNDGLVTATPTDRSSFVDFEKISGTIHSIESGAIKGTNEVVINYKSSFKWFLEQYINIIRVELFLKTKSTNRNDFSVSASSNILYQFLNLIAFPLTIKMLSSNKRLSVIEAIEYAKYELLKGTGLLKEDFMEGIVPIARFDENEKRLIFINKDLSDAKKDKRAMWVAEALLGKILDCSFEREPTSNEIIHSNWIQKSSKEIIRTHKPLQMLLKNLEKTAPDMNWFNNMVHKDNLDLTQILMMLLNSRENKIKQIVEKLNAETNAIQESMCDASGLLFDLLSLAPGLTYGEIGSLGKMVVIENLLLDPYHLQKILIHNMAGIQGVNYERDWRDISYYEFVNGEWNAITHTDAYAPLKTAYLFFALLERYFYTLERNAVEIGGGRVLRGYNPWEYIKTIYSENSDIPLSFPIPTDENKFTLRNYAYITRFPSQAKVGDAMEHVSIHINLATQSAIRQLFDFFTRMTLLTQNRNNEMFKQWSQLIDTMGVYRSVYKMLSADPKDSLDSIRLTDKIWEVFADSTNMGTQPQQCHPKLKQITMPINDMTTFFKQVNSKQASLYYEFVNGIAGGFLSKLLNIKKTDLTLIDLLKAMVIHYDSQRQEFYKLVDYQACDENGNWLSVSILPDGRSKAIESAVWGIEKVFLSKKDFDFDRTWNGREDPLLKGEKPYTKTGVDPTTYKGGVLNEFLTKMPIFKQYTAEGEWNGRYSIYLIALNGKETHKTVGQRTELIGKDENNNEKYKETLIDVDLHDLYNLSPEEFKKYLENKIGLKKSQVEKIDPVIIDYECLNFQTALITKLYQETKVETEALKSKGILAKAETAFKTLDNFVEKTIWLTPIWRGITESIAGKMVGRLWAFGRRRRIGFSIEIEKENIEEYFKKIKNEPRKAFLAAQTIIENNKQADRSRIWALAINRLLEKKRRGALSEELQQNDPAQMVLAPEVAGVENSLNLLNLPPNKKNPKELSRDTHNGKIKDRPAKKILQMLACTSMTISIGFGVNLMMQMGYYHVIAAIVQGRYTEAILENMNTMRDLNKDGRYDEYGEVGSIANRYFVRTGNNETNAQNNLTRYKASLTYAALVWTTDYMELGGDVWEFVNGYLMGEQLAHIALGMPMVFAEDTESLAEAFKAVRQLEGKRVPEKLLQWMVSPSFQRAWKWFLLAFGGAISTIGEMVNGFLVGGATGGLTGAVGGAAVGWLKGVIGVFQSMAAGRVADETWQAGLSSAATNTWKGQLLYSWTSAMKGDKDGLIAIHKAMSWLWEFGRGFAPKSFSWVYLSSYCDVGPWAGPFDSLLPLGAWWLFCYTVLLPVLSLLPLPGGRVAAFLISTAAAVVYSLYYLLTFWLGMKILARWHLLPDAYLPSYLWGD